MGLFARTLVYVSLMSMVLPLFGCSDDDDGQPAVTATPTLTRTELPTATATATPSPASTATATPSPTFSFTTTATATASATASATNTAPPTPTATTVDTLCPDSEVRLAGLCLTAGGEAAFRLDILDANNPFPDDRYRDEGGRLLPPPWTVAEIGDPNVVASSSASAFTDALLAAIRDNASGWGNFSPIELRLSAELDPATIADGLFVLRYDGEGWRSEAHDFVPTWHAGLQILDLQPQMPFDASTTYAVVLTSALATTDGAPLGRSSDFRRVLRGDAGGELQSLLDAARDELGVGRDEIALAFTFTTQATWQDLVAIRERLDSDELMPPAITFEDLPSTRYQEGVFTEGPVKDQLLRGHGAEFRLAAVGTAQLYDFRGRNFTFDSAAVNGPNTPRTVPVRVEIAIPNGPMPEGGYAVLLLGHGLGQSADFVWDIAQKSAELGMIPPFMLIAADFPNHGARGSGGMIADVIQYFHLNNFYAMRDSFRETAAELLEMRRAIEAASGGPFDLVNRDKILFAGASLGGINGATFLGVDSKVRTALLSVPAGELVRILEGEEVGKQITPVIAALVGITPTSPAYPDFFRLLVNRGLWIMGAGDPISYAPFIVRDQQLPGATRKSVLIQEGIGDGVLPNVTTEDLARVMGVPIVTGEVSCDQPGCGVSGMWQFDLADYGRAGTEPHQVSAELREAQAQLLTYLASDGQLILDASPAP